MKGLPFSFALVAVILLLMLGPSPRTAHAQTLQDCRNDRNNTRCVEMRLRRILEPYDVRPIEAHRATGDQVRRVFYVDSFGRALLLISFVRARGGIPTVWVNYPRRENRPTPAPLTAGVPWVVWQDVLSRSTYFDRGPAPLPSAGEPSICLDGWTYLVEATDPAPEGRRAVENACEFGPAARYAAEVERAALPLFPHCARLASRQYPLPSLQLLGCRLLRGDRIVAAEVMNLTTAFQTISGQGDAGRLAGVLTARTRIDWNGERNEPPASAATFWAMRATPAIGVTNLSIESIEGEAPGRVRLTGTLLRPINGVAMETARVEQLWVREPGGAFRVESATVGPWEPYPPRRVTATNPAGS
jgi:hypothetical protein